MNDNSIHIVRIICSTIVVITIIVAASLLGWNYMTIKYSPPPTAVAPTNSMLEQITKAHEEVRKKQSK